MARISILRLVLIAVALGAVVIATVLTRSPSTTTSRSSSLVEGASFPWEQDPPPRSLVPLEEIRSGGPPPDGIPPIDEPKFIGVGEADEWLEDREPVILLERGSHARAYPLQVLTWHEIVNDEIDGDPVTVTFCPLCNSAIAFERLVTPTDAARQALGEQEVVLDFGTSGRLYRSNLVMYDRQTKSLWIQFTGQAVAGPFISTELEKVPVQIVSWADFMRAHPDGQVLSRDTGHSRNYGSNPYQGYDSIDSSPFLFDGPTDDRMPPMLRLVSVMTDQGPRAYTYRRLRELADEGASVVQEEGRVIFYELGVASALDDAQIAAGTDIGTTGVFVPNADGESLTFEVRDGRIIDLETGSAWSIDGKAVDGPLAGAALEPIVHDDTFWFVWAAFQPETTIWDGP